MGNAPRGTNRPATRSPRIAVVGDVALDLILEIDDPSIDEKVQASMVHQRLGGTGANAAAALMALGDAVDLVAAVGTDVFGRWVRDAISRTGLTSRHVRTVAGSTTLAVVVLRSGRRSLIVHRGVADSLDVDHVVRRIKDATLVYLSGQPQLLCARVVAQTHGQVVIGVEARQLADVAGWLPIFARATAVLTNQAGAAALAGHEDTGDWSAASSAALVTTRGADGCTVQRAGQPATKLAALKVMSLDATGAGDCFAAALCHWLSRGFDVIASARFATAAAGLSTTAIGAQGALPDEAAVEEAARYVGARPTQGRRA